MPFGQPWSLEPRIVRSMVPSASSIRLSMVGLLGVVLQRLAASLRRPPEEDVVRPVLVRVFGIGPVAHFGEQLLMPLLEGVGDVFQKDQPEHDVLVLGRLHVVAQLVGGEPELGLEAEIGGGVRRRFRFRFNHEVSSLSRSQIRGVRSAYHGDRRSSRETGELRNRFERNFEVLMPCGNNFPALPPIRSTPASQNRNRSLRSSFVAA